MVESALTLLKLVGIVLAGVFGVLGTIKDYKTPSGKITRWGRLALVGIVAGTVLAVATQILETIRDSADADERAKAALDELERSREVLARLEHQGVLAARSLAELERTISIVDFSKMDFNTSLVLPPDLEGMEEYAAQALAHYNEIRDHTIAGFEQRLGLFDVDEEVVNATTMSTALPNIVRELFGTEFRLAFYRTPIEGEDYRPYQEGLGPIPDLLLIARDGPSRLEYRKTKKQARWTVHRATASTTVLASTGAITSLADLRGAQIFVCARIATREEAPGYSVRHALFSPTITLGPGQLGWESQKLQIPESAWTPAVDGAHNHVYMLKFPTDRDAFNELVRPPLPGTLRGDQIYWDADGLATQPR